MPTPAEAAARSLVWEIDSRQSVEIATTSEFKSLDAKIPTADAEGTIEQLYIETAAGERFLDARHAPNTGRHSHYQYFSDSRRFADVSLGDGKQSPAQVVVKSAFFLEGTPGLSSTPEPSLYERVERIPLTEALPKGDYSHTSSVLGRECNVFHFGKLNVPGVEREYRYWLDRKTGIPLQVATYLNKEDYTANRPFMWWEANSFDEVEGHHLAKRSTTFILDGQRQLPAGRDEVPCVKLVEIKTTVTEVHFDRDYPASRFWPDPKLTAAVHNLVDNTYSPPRASQTPAIANAIRVAPPKPSNLWGNAGVGLGVALLLFGGIVWWRGRERRKEPMKRL